MKRTMLLLTTLGALLLSGCTLGTNADITCRYTEELTATIPAENAKTLRVEALAGSLEIKGKPGLTEVKVRGTACTNDEDLLSDIQISTGSRDGEVHVEANLPQIQGISFGRSTSLDLVVEVPASWLVKVNDDSGETTINGVASVQITDGSGEITITEVAGDVTVRDDSGDLTIKNVGGKVSLEDGSGSIRVEKVTGDVTIEVDDSGDIDVNDVQGAFTVERDGSGDIRYSSVAGKVRVPRD